MISKKMADALNKHMNLELYSAHLYLSMSSCSSEKGLKGAANWFMVQYQEEMFHAMKLFEYVQRQGEDIKLDAIKAPPKEFTVTPSICTRLKLESPPRMKSDAAEPRCPFCVSVAPGT